MAANRKKAPKTILVVEDESLSREHAVSLLEEAGFRVFKAANAADAIRVLEANSGVEILFTDIQMPGHLNGLALAHAVHHRWPHIKLLITSGLQKPREEDIPGDGRFIPKPFLPNALLSVINNLS